eukprot:140242-Pyramimonas_sp.AAC.1
MLFLHVLCNLSTSYTHISNQTRSAVVTLLSQTGPAKASVEDTCVFYGCLQMRSTLAQLRLFLTDGSPNASQVDAIRSKVLELKDRHPIEHTQALRKFLPHPRVLDAYIVIG